MIFRVHYLLVFATLVLLPACGDDEPEIDWLIPRDEVFDGGPGKDGIPSIDRPQFSAITDIDFLDDDDLVIGIQVGEEIRAYPHPILDWHEIINDEFEDASLTLTYCPLTGTGIGWNRMLNGEKLTFGVSGLLYNSNLIPYDRQSDSNWSQMELRAVSGNQSGTSIETYPVIETTWKSWKTAYPASQVMNTNTLFSRNYDEYPYGSYRTNDDLLLFPVANTDNRLGAKDRGFGIMVDSLSKFYPLSLFSNNERVRADKIGGQDVLIIGNSSDNYLVAYQSRLEDGSIVVPNEQLRPSLPIVFVDTEGNEWDIFGRAIGGPREGSQLSAVRGYMAYWFAWVAFFPGVEIAQ